MPTIWSTTLIPTLREVPAEAEAPSHRLMLRAGLIRKLGSGVYDYLPLGLRSLQKVAAIIREEMAAAGAVEVLLPAIVPIELYKRTGRDEAYGDNLFRLTDRHGREQALGPTHEEVITELVGAYVESYRQLPLTLYQIQTKFRDEFRPRFGVLRSREFLMKDAYSFHTRVEGEGGLDETYQKQYDAYCRIFDRCGLTYEIVEAESGPIGGSASHEFMIPSPTGEDTILKSDTGNYAANVEKCEIGMRDHDLDGAPTGEIKEIATPDCSSIDDLCMNWPKFSGSHLKPKHVLKTLVYHVEGDLTASEQETKDKLRSLYGDQVSDEKFHFYCLAVVRGDHEINEAKLKEAWLEIHGREMKPLRDNPGPRLMDEKEAIAAGFSVGYVGPHAIHAVPDSTRMRTYLVVDPDAAQSQFWVAGANKDGYHCVNFNWKRDIEWHANHHPFHIKDIRNAIDGDPAPAERGGGVLRETKGIEVGHVFKLGCKYSDAMNVSVLDENNQQQSIIMGCYGIGVNRILAAAIERDGGNDDNGIVWPGSIAPFQVLITPIKYQGALRDTADRLATEIERMQSPTSPKAFFHPDVLIDDRDERPGVKFKDADLVGIPVRITIGDKALADGCVEIKARNGSNGPKGELVPVEKAAARVIELLGQV